ncbi:hypothetical protein LCGC14_1610970 [marine sediment metagenome]|uniref:Uncharacterized protein n=1 Tax=marine sediment metagenome TaxID=412755 RepID=A0A0F9I897_9ZZZZ
MKTTAAYRARCDAESDQVWAAVRDRRADITRIALTAPQSKDDVELIRGILCLIIADMRKADDLADSLE